MTDLANLGFDVDTGGLVKGTKALETMSAASSQAEKSMTRLTDEIKSVKKQQNALSSFNINVASVQKAASALSEAKKKAQELKLAASKIPEGFDLTKAREELKILSAFDKASTAVDKASLSLQKARLNLESLQEQAKQSPDDMNLGNKIASAKIKVDELSNSLAVKSVKLENAQTAFKKTGVSVDNVSDKIQELTKETTEYSNANQLAKTTAANQKSVERLTSVLDKQKSTLAESKTKLQSLGLSSRNAGEQIEALERKSGKLNSKLVISKQRTESLKDSLTSVAAQTRKTSDEFAKASNTSLKLKNSMSSLMGVMGGFSAVTLGAGMVSMASNFDDAMNTVQSKLLITTDEMQTLNDKAKELGSTTQFSATQAGEGMSFLAQAGLDADQILTAIPDTLNLAAAAGLTLAQSADIATNVLGGFKLPVTELSSVVDTLALTSAKANTSVEELAMALKQAGPVAKGYGISVADTAAVIGTFANNGFKGEQAGMAFKNMLLNIAAPAGAGEKALEKLNLQTSDFFEKLPDGEMKFKGTSEMLDTLAKSGANATDMITIFGREAGPAIATLVGEGLKIDELAERIVKTGAASEMAALRMQGLTGVIKITQSTWEALNLHLADSGGRDAAISGLETLTSVMRSVIDNTEEWTLGIGILATAIFSSQIKATSTAISTNYLLVTSSVAATKAQYQQATSSKVLGGAMAGAALTGRAFAGVIGLLGGPLGLLALAAGATYTYRKEIGELMTGVKASTELEETRAKLLGSVKTLSEEAATATDSLAASKRKDAEASYQAAQAGLADLKVRAKLARSNYNTAKQAEANEKAQGLSIQYRSTENLNARTVAARNANAEYQAQLALVQDIEKELSNFGKQKIVIPSVTIEGSTPETSSINKPSIGSGLKETTAEANKLKGLLDSLKTDEEKVNGQVKYYETLLESKKITQEEFNALKEKELAKLAKIKTTSESVTAEQRKVKELTESALTPLQKFQKYQKEIQNLVDKHGLSQAAANVEIENARKQYEATAATQVKTSKAYNEQEAYKQQLINETRTALEKYNAEVDKVKLSIADDETKKRKLEALKVAYDNHTKSVYENSKAYKDKLEQDNKDKERNDRRIAQNKSIAKTIADLTEKQRLLNVELNQGSDVARVEEIISTTQGITREDAQEQYAKEKGIAVTEDELSSRRNANELLAESNRQLELTKILINEGTEAKKLQELADQNISTTIAQQIIANDKQSEQMLKLKSDTEEWQASFTDAVMSGKDGIEDFFETMIMNAAKARLELALFGNQSLGTSGTGGIVGGVSDAISGFLGFSSGGYTGNVGRSDVAGVVHGQEYVINAEATSKNRELLEAINAGKDVTETVTSPTNNYISNGGQIASSNNIYNNTENNNSSNTSRSSQDSLANFVRTINEGNATSSNTLNSVIDNQKRINAIGDSVYSNSSNKINSSLLKLSSTVNAGDESSVSTFDNSVDNQKKVSSAGDSVYQSSDSKTDNLFNKSSVSGNTLTPEKQSFNYAASDSVYNNADSNSFNESIYSNVAGGNLSSIVKNISSNLLSESTQNSSNSGGLISSIVKSISSNSTNSAENNAVYDSVANKVYSASNDSFSNAVSSASNNSMTEYGSSVYNDMKSNINKKLFGGFRATGGQVDSQKSYVVGEQGPEIFSPSESGNIISNSDLTSSAEQENAESDIMITVNLNEDSSKAGTVESNTVDNKQIIDVFVSNIRQGGAAASVVESTYSLKRSGSFL